VVIVVIGILAAITIVSYSGITQRAAAATLQSDLKTASTKLEIYKAENDAYPATKTDAENAGCLPASDGTDFQYTVSGGNYSLSATSSTSDDIAFHISSEVGGIEEGVDIAAGHIDPNEPVWKYVTAGDQHTCAIGSDSLAYCWGRGDLGAMGNNTTISSRIPVPVSTAGALSGKTIKSMSTGSAHTCAIASGDLAYCWGWGGDGRLGNNSTSLSSVPVAVDRSGVLSGKTMKAITSEMGHTCAIASDDLAYCWGDNSFGQLGNNSTTNSLVPVAVSMSGLLSGKTIKAISSGQYHVCVIASDDLLYCWGYNANGRLGNNSTTDSLVPVAVNTAGVLSGKTVQSLSLGYQHTCAIASDDLAYCWGLNGYGQLGNNSTSESLVPVAVSTAGVLSGKTIKNITGGYQHTCAIDSDNRASCWGRNDDYGRLGNNSLVNSSIPIITADIP
jgi:alpha-tubulin suppressor-like RCC1 family protein/Tfp pilus assembly major pilin PilA